MRICRFMSSVVLAIVVVGGAALISNSANASTYDWTFTSNSSVSASGVLTVDGNGDVTALSGNVGGQAIAFYANPNFYPFSGGYPGTSTMHGVPNSGGADLIYDDYFNPSTNSVTIDGILISGGSGASEIVYALSLDNNPPLSTGGPGADLFSFTSGGGYVFNEGTLSSTLAATPLPSTWTMLIAGFVGLGFFAYRGTKKGSAAIAAA